MICYVLAMGKEHLGPHVVVGYGIKFFWPGVFITSPDHLVFTKLASFIFVLFLFFLSCAIFGIILGTCFQEKVGHNRPACLLEWQTLPL